jgi:hypothetical protein
MHLLHGRHFKPCCTINAHLALCILLLLQVDPCVAYHLWVLVFPIVWATLQKQQQINLAKPIISLLSKEYHQRQAMARPNVVQVNKRAAADAVYCLQINIELNSGQWQGCRAACVCDQLFLAFAARSESACFVFCGKFD